MDRYGKLVCKIKREDQFYNVILLFERLENCWKMLQTLEENSKAIWKAAQVNLEEQLQYILRILKCFKHFQDCHLISLSAYLLH